MIGNKLKYLCRSIEPLKYRFNHTIGRPNKTVEIGGITLMKGLPQDMKVAQVGDTYINYRHCIQIDNVTLLVGEDNAIGAVLDDTMQLVKSIQLGHKEIGGSWYLGALTSLMEEYLRDRQLIINGFTDRVHKNVAYIAANTLIRMGHLIEVGEFEDSTIFGIMIDVPVDRFDSDEVNDIAGNLREYRSLVESTLGNDAICGDRLKDALPDMYSYSGRSLLVLYFVKDNKIVDIGCSVSLSFERHILEFGHCIWKNSRFFQLCYYSISKGDWVNISECDTHQRLKNQGSTNPKGNSKHIYINTSDKSINLIKNLKFKRVVCLWQLVVDGQIFWKNLTWHLDEPEG